MRKLIGKYFIDIVDFLVGLKMKHIQFKAENPPFIILTPGKVGSSTIFHTLKNQINNKVYHVHSLNRSKIENKYYELKKSNFSVPFHLVVSKHLEKKLRLYKGKIYIITIIREPIKRMISSYFQNIERYSNTKSDINVALNTINEHLKDAIEYYDVWFESELKENFQIDIYKIKKFDKYFIIRSNNVHFLLIRMEDLNNAFSIAFNELTLYNKSINLINSNVGVEKKYSEFYQQVKEKVIVDDSLINKVKMSKFMSKFYNDLDV